MKVADIRSDYIKAPVSEKIWIVLVHEFGEYDGSKFRVVRALYGMKISEAAFWKPLADCMHHLGFLPCPSDLYLCMNTMVSPEYGFNYYAYVLIYVNYVIVIQHDDGDILRRIDKYFKIKPRSIGDPYIKLGAKLKKTRLANGAWEWKKYPRKIR